LTAPHGTIDAGAAGIRVAGNLNLVALQVLNAFNIDVQGVTIGIPTAASPNVGALTSATNAAGAAQANVAAPVQHTRTQPSILIVEIEGYGGDDNETTPVPEQPKKHNPTHSQQSYNDRSPYQVLGVGSLSPEEIDGLAEVKQREAQAR
jgi:hypothetical protein